MLAIAKLTQPALQFNTNEVIRNITYIILYIK